MIVLEAGMRARINVESLSIGDSSDGVEFDCELVKGQEVTIISIPDERHLDSETGAQTYLHTVMIEAPDTNGYMRQFPVDADVLAPIEE